MRCALQPATRATAEHGSEKLGRQIQHTVDEAAVEIHVGADAFVDFPLLADDDRSQALHIGVETKFFLAAFFGSQAVDEGFENIGTGVGDGVDGVTHSVDQTLMIESFPV